MSKSLSITIHPSALNADYLSVSDAMHQVLDVIDALEKVEEGTGGRRQIVWRLTEAHTSSPPFTVTVEAFPIESDASISQEARRVVSGFSDTVKALLDGRKPEGLIYEAMRPLKNALDRNTAGVGRTEISIEDEEPFNIVPAKATAALVTLERLALDLKAATVDHSRTEFGALEVEVHGITRWNGKPALAVTERLSREKVTCVLTRALAETLGPAHNWGDAWEGQRLLVTGALHYDPDSILKRIDAEEAETMPWTDVSLSDVRDIDVLQGRSVNEHLRLLRGGEIG